MKREITFGGRSALLSAGEHRAMLTVYESADSTLPVGLADEINEAGDITVTEVFRVGNDTALRMVHDLTPSDVLGVVCEAIGKVYDADTAVSYARPENAV